MRSSTRVFVNTIAQYIKTIFSAIITLYTSRLVLFYLGINDYGINDLVAGVIAMFSFANLTLSMTTQRYLSYYQGKGDAEMCNKVFNNSMIALIIIAVIICGGLLLLTEPIFSFLLKIEEERLNAAYCIYYWMIASLLLNIISTPYQALLIAHENIVYSSFVLMIISILKIPVALSLGWVVFDKLEWYGFCCFILILIELIFYVFYCKYNYNECKILNYKDIDKQLLKNMFAFTGWTLYGPACVIGRYRGITILINRFFTTAMNGAMGIGGQISSQLSFLSTALTNSMRPQIIKAEGSGNRQKLFRMTEICCKVSFFLLTMISIPSILEMEQLMSLWLIEVPPYAVFFAQAFIISAWVDQTTVGLSIANSATGNVKLFQLVTNTVKILALPITYIVLKMGYKVESVMVVYILFECICSCIRLYILKKSINLKIIKFLQNVLLPMCIPTVCTITACYYVSSYLHGIYCFVNYIVSFLVLTTLTLFLGINKEEKEILRSIIHK